MRFRIDHAIEPKPIQFLRVDQIVWSTLLTRGGFSHPNYRAVRPLRWLGDNRLALVNTSPFIRTQSIALCSRLFAHVSSAILRLIVFL